MPGSIDIRILGPIEVYRAGTLVAIPAGKQRGLLGLLAMRVGRVQSTDLLIDALWGAEPPASARNALQVLVSSLRKLLGDDLSVRLETSGQGYVLRAEPDGLDLLRFEQFVDQGGAALGAGEEERASELLGRALELWRGHPLEGLDLPGLPVGEITDLEERRAHAIQLRLEADLAIGRHLEIVPELEGMLAVHALDERLHALAALALYRAGRQSDGLEILARLRRALSRELGIEPGPGITRLERQMLEHDPELEPPPRLPDMAPREARRTVSALVCRISASGGAGRLDPESQRAALGSTLEAAREVIGSHGGTIAEAVGGRMVAIFGTPQVHEDDPIRAVRAAEELRSASRGWPHPEGIRLELRVGVATGEVVVRDVGEERSLLTADPLEEADRLAQAARPGEVLLTHVTGRHARHAVDAEPAEIVLLGEEGHPTSALRLLDVSTEIHHGRRLSSPLVGRANELAVLRQSYARVARERMSSLVTVLGPAGIGKSRLVAEFATSVSSSATVLSGRCLPYGRDITFWPIAEIVRGAAGIALGERADAAAAKLSLLLAGERDAGYITELILAILGLAEVAAPAEEISWAVRRFLAATARVAPVVAVFDDLHWADATLLDLIEYVVGSTRDAPVLLVCLARPDLIERRPTWGGGRLDATNLTLASLDDDESSLLLHNLLGRAELDVSARKRILEAAEGHPLFLEEVLAMLIDEKILDWLDGRWTLLRDLSFPLPPTVQALLDARLDRLSAAERATVEHAAIIGREFSDQDLRALVHEDPIDLEQALEGLVRRDFLELERISRTGRTYRFRHTLLRDAVYEGTAKGARAADHEAFGGYLEERAGDRLAEIEEVVGYHLEAAARNRRELGSADRVLSARAVARLSSAGHRAFSREDMPAAASFFGRTLALLKEDDPLRPECYWHLGVALFDMGRFTEADETLLEGIEVAERLGAAPWEWRMRIEQAELGFWRNPKVFDTRALEALASEALEEFGRSGDKAGMARACRLLGDALARRGQNADASELFVKAHAWAVEAGDEREAAEKQTSGGAHGAIPADRCIEIVQGNLDRARRPNPDALAALGLVLAMVGRSQESHATFDEGLERARELGVEWKTANVLMHLGAALLVEDDAANAEAALRPAVESLQRMGEQGMLSTAVALLAEALYRLSRDDDAMLATIVSEGAAADDDVASQMAWRGVRAKILARRGDLREAERIARDAVVLADGTDLLNMGGDAHRDLASVLEVAGRGEEARGELERALEFYESKGNVVSAASARSMIARLAVQHTAGR